MKNNDTYLLGQSIGLDKAASILLQKATEAFGMGRDSDAKLLRTLSQEIQREADETYQHPKI